MLAILSWRMIPSKLLHQLGPRFRCWAVAIFIVSSWCGCSSTKQQGVSSNEIMGALDRFDADCGRFPTTAEGLSALVKNPGLARWKGPYWEGGFGDRWGTTWRYDNTGWPTLRSPGGKLIRMETWSH
jgi:hypothetical protein